MGELNCVLLFVIELMISVAGRIDAEIIERFDHLEAFFVSGENRWRKCVSREEQEGVLTVLLPYFGEPSFEIDNPAFVLFGLNIINIVEVQERNERFEGKALLRFLGLIAKGHRK